jgi:hypothetical protein
MTASPNTSLRRSTATLAALLASLAFAPAALASTVTPPDRTDGLGGANQTSHIVAVLPPDRVDALGGSSAVIHTTFTPPPDRVDGFGGSNYTPIAAPAVIVRTSAGFDWTAAVLGAIAGLGISLIVMAAWLTRGRRDVALPS